FFSFKNHGQECLKIKVLYNDTEQFCGICCSALLVQETIMETTTILIDAQPLVRMLVHMVNQLQVLIDAELLTVSTIEHVSKTPEETLTSD
ncbi:hypothetical protein L9F63_012893, partial [Diploptera punctata]